MKKLLIAFLILLFFSFPAMAAWTIQAEIEKDTQWSNDQRIYRIKVYMLSDGTDLAEFNLSTYLSPPYTDTQGKVHPYNMWREKPEGGMFRQLETDPGTAPDAVYTLAVNSDVGAPILSLTDLSATISAFHNPADATTGVGYAPIVYDLKINIGDIGSNLDEVTLYIYMVK